jgi:hypothetical protein
MMKSFYGRARVLLAVVYLLSYFSAYASAVTGCGAMPQSIRAIWDPANLQMVGYALGLLMVVIQGVRYIIADSAQERADVKKGLIYIVVGLLIVTGYTTLTDFYCTIAGVRY